MKKFIAQDGPRTGANPSIEQMEDGTKPLEHLTNEDASQGSEYLDDALRMHEQPLATTGPNDDE